MNVDNIHFKISKSNQLDNYEKSILLEIFKNMFIKKYGFDIVSEHFISENYLINEKEIEKTNDLKNLILIYKEKKLIGAAIVKYLNNFIVDIKDIAIYCDTEEEKRNIWKLTINYTIRYFKKNGCKKIYLEIPVKEPFLLSRADDLGFKEDPTTELEYDETIIYLYSKNLEDESLILNINKDEGYTSRDVVNKLSKILNIKKVGHTGTLDPLATGVLICLTGKYTKLVDLITSYEKEYVAEIKLGIETDTLDITGNILKKEDVKEHDYNTIKNVLNSFIGSYEQSIPKYSAVSINGKRLYEYARNNIEIDIPKRLVEIKSIELLEYNKDIIKFKVLVSKGTYIRSLIKDICDKLNTIGTMNKLIRTKQGNFNIENSYSLEDISNKNYKTLNLEDILNLTTVELDEYLYKKVINGNKLNLEYEGFILFKKNNIDIALYYFEDKIGNLKILL